MEQALTRLLSAISIYERLRPQNSELPLKKKVLVLQCSKLYFYFFPVLNLLGTAVAQWVEALCYKSEGRGFDSRWHHWNFSLA